MRKVGIIGIIILSIVGNVFAQKGGIRFEQVLSWNGVKEKARAEKKYIFIDCYTTWCGPCRFMADSIFTRTSVGDFMNNQFISVQVQMDTSKSDNALIKSRYKDANDLLNKYKINAFPTFLFLNPDGDAVHIGVGVKDEKEFILFASDAVDKNKQYYTQLEKYRNGYLEYESFPKLAYYSKELGFNELAISIARDYMHKYLDKLPDLEFCKKENFDFIGKFHQIFNSKERIFKFYYSQPDKVDSIMQQKGYAKGFIEYIIYKEEITPAIKIAKLNNSNPQWDSLAIKIRKKYTKDCANKSILNAKIEWFRYKNDWRNYTHYLVQSVENSDVSNLPSNAGNILYLNNNAWDVFQYSNNVEELKKAVYWMDIAISMDPTTGAGLIDTKANLLYKLGKKNEAIAFEQKAVSLEKNFQEFQITLKKMKNGIPTWSVSQ